MFRTWGLLPEATEKQVDFIISAKHSTPFRAHLLSDYTTDEFLRKNVADYLKHTYSLYAKRDLII